MSDGTSVLGARAANWAAEYSASLKRVVPMNTVPVSPAANLMVPERISKMVTGIYGDYEGENGGSRVA